MGWGGRRRGAGRKRKPIAPIAQRDLDFIERLRGLPPERAHLPNRVVLALAARGAELPEIAAVLNESPSCVANHFSSELETGRAIALVGLVHRIWTKARAGDSRAMIHLAAKMDKISMKDSSEQDGSEIESKTSSGPEQ